MTETEARRVLLVQAHEAGAETALWTADDRAWATRVALHDVGDAAAPERFVVERARHALERLLPRDAAARRWLARRFWRPLWIAAAALGAALIGVLVDHIGAPQRVDLLAPPVWAVVLWNLAVYVGLLVPHPSLRWRGALARRWLGGGPAPWAVLWARHGAPLTLARVALLLHVAAAALALGIVAGMYLRGLVLDYRAGWQSTFLGAPVVQALLNVLLAPASAATGIVVPEVAALRVLPDQPATASAAPWIHLYAATLALFVVVPRTLLALAAAWRATRLVRCFPLSLETPYFDRLRAQQQGSPALVQVFAHGAAVQAQAALGLRSVLASAYGDDLQLRFEPATAYGDEDRIAETANAPAVTPPALTVALFDFAATPEAEAQGRFASALQGALPLLLVADEADFNRRFGGLPERRAERRATWERFAATHGIGLVCVDLDRPDLGAAARALQAALQR